MEAHPETIDADLRVALALAKGETNVGPWTGPGCTPEGYEAEDCQCCDALDPRRFNDSVEELIALGFLEDALSFDQEHVLEFVYRRAACRSERSASVVSKRGNYVDGSYKRCMTPSMSIPALVTSGSSGSHKEV